MKSKLTLASHLSSHLILNQAKAGLCLVPNKQNIVKKILIAGAQSVTFSPLLLYIYDVDIPTTTALLFVCI